MEYKDIFLLQNPYPSVTNYDTLDNSNIVLSGVYPQNFIEFTIPPFSDIEVVENTTFRFVLAIKETSLSDDTRYFTSPNFYSDLESSKIDNNPYHLQTALDEGLFVNISLDKQIELFNQLKLIDYGTGVKMNQNIFLLNDNTVDYVTLVQYIDWVVSKADPLDNDNNGVIPGEKIADFEIGKFDPKTGEFISLKDQAVALQVRVDALNEELAEVENALQAMESDLPEEPQKRKTGVLEIISLGLGAVAVAQGAAAAIKGGTAAFGAAANVAKATPRAEIIPLPKTSIKPIPPVSTPAIKAPDFSKIFPGYTPPSSITSNVSKTIGSVAKDSIKQATSVFNTVKNFAKTAGSTVVKGVSGAAKFATKAAGSRIGQAVISSAATAAATGALNSAATTAVTDPMAARKKQTDIVLKSVAKSAAVEVGKLVAKQAAKKLAGAAVGKILGAATGPIGAGIMAAIGIVKFFVKKNKEKKEFEKQKKEYEKVMGEFERLTKRRDDILAELNGILKSGKLTLAREFNERFSSTQKYFANIGQSIVETQQAQQTAVQPAVQSSSTTPNPIGGINRRRNLGG
jgi:hypothetical protein